MPELRPFQGIRYSSSIEIAEVVCPPYDVISPEEQSALHERHPNNAVRLELATDPGGGEAEKYRNAASTFRSWLESGILVRDESPSLYVYRQDFVGPRGDRRKVVGVIGSLRLEEFGTDSGVLPHERTMPGPKADRLALLRALGVNVSPIYSIYRGGGELSSYYEDLVDRPAVARAVDDSDTLHRLWRVEAAGEIELLAGAVAAGPLVIADGHHRYETALAYHSEMAGRPGTDRRTSAERPGGHDGIMCLVVDADSEDIVVLPYNRAVRASVDASSVPTTLVDRFGGRRLGSEDSELALDNSAADHPFVFVGKDIDVLVEVTDEMVVDQVGDSTKAWRDLDVVALHEALLPELFPDGIDQVEFSKDPDEIRTLVRESFTTGVLLRALLPAQIVDVARSGERMPQKASYFWPKAVTGLVFRSLE